MFGYFNRNWQQELAIPAGADNTVELGGPDAGQPTFFLPRRQRFVFRVRVPKDFGKKEVVWSITANGRTEHAFGSLIREQEITERVVITNGGYDPGLNDPNKPPSITVAPDSGGRRGQPGHTDRRGRRRWTAEATRRACSESDDEQLVWWTGEFNGRCAATRGPDGELDAIRWSSESQVRDSGPHLGNERAGSDDCHVHRARHVSVRRLGHRPRDDDESASHRHRASTRQLKTIPGRGDALELIVDDDGHGVTRTGIH